MREIMPDRFQKLKKLQVLVSENPHQELDRHKDEPCLMVKMTEAVL